MWDLRIVLGQQSLYRCYWAKTEINSTKAARDASENYDTGFVTAFDTGPGERRVNEVVR